ncbi:MAG: hypothetical protein KIT72_19685 [Polyangiaceae bacterium]|nr:hypothetical protein [Polyangiaceae bacterium]MCW5792644.1 hypothetical protein [Polyangiaceae bacterium]
MRQRQLGIATVVVSVLLALGASGCAFDSEEEPWADDTELSEGSEQLELGGDEAQVLGAEQVTEVPEGEATPDLGQGQLLTDPNPLPWHDQGRDWQRPPSTPVSLDSSRAR